MQSMTGFGRGHGESAGYRFAAEARSVNHRHLEVLVRLRDPFRELESRLRALVAERIARGRVELAVEIEPLGDSETALRVRRGPILELATQVAELAASRPDLGLPPPTWGDLLRVPDAVVVQSRGSGFGEDDVQVLTEVCVGAVDAMVSARSREGQALGRVLAELSRELRQLVESIAAELPALREQLAERTRLRLRELLAGEPQVGSVAESGSWVPEALAYAERSDVTEELDRLRAHLDQLDETCAAAAPAGRRLDFLAQELLRELQTLGAKCRALDVAGRLLQAKLVTDRIREQVQNVE
jgi:uncharacterized protein (TIGR00255 family)